MNNEILYRVYLTGEKHIVGFLRDNEPVIFTDDQIEELKKMPEDKQEEYALKLKSQ